MALRGNCHALTRCCRAVWYKAVVRLDGCRAYLSYQSEPDVERKVEILGGGLLVEDGESETQRWRRVGPSTRVGGVVAVKRMNRTREIRREIWKDITQ